MSPTQHLEEALVDLLLTVADMNKPLSAGEGIKLANELIKDMKLEDYIIAYMKLEEYIIAYKLEMKMHFSADNRNKDEPILVLGWCQRFMKRLRHKLPSATGRTFSCNREDWCTYDNFLNMYNCIHEEMVGAGVKKKLVCPCSWMPMVMRWTLKNLMGKNAPIS